MMLRILFALALCSSLALAQDDAVVTDPLLAEPALSLGEKPTGTLLEPKNEPQLVEELAKPAEPTPAPSIPSVMKQESRAVAGDDGIFWSLHEGGKNHIQLTFVLNGFAERDFDPTTVEKKFSAQGVRLQYLFFPVVGSWGRFGFGPVAGAYRGSRNETKGSPLALYTMGAKANYEFKFQEAQMFVPFLEATYEKVSMRSFTYGRSVNTFGDVTDQGTSVPGLTYSESFYGFGLLINLNRLEPSTASRSLANAGIKKFYLAYSAEQRDGTNHNLGLRFEF